MLATTLEPLASPLTSLIEKMIVPAAEGRRCIDGRYNQGQGRIARPGGDLGYSLGLLALSNEKG